MKRVPIVGVVHGENPAVKITRYEKGGDEDAKPENITTIYLQIGSAQESATAARHLRGALADAYHAGWNDGSAVERAVESDV